MAQGKKIIIYTDGGARGNPGPAAIGVIIQDGQGNIVKKYGQYIGEATNNVAEYSALVSALKKIKQIFGKEKIRQKDTEIEVFMDSELVVRQMKGEYKIQEKELQELFMEIWNLRVELGSMKFVHIKREKNHEADKLVNEALDNYLSEQKLF